VCVNLYTELQNELFKTHIIAHMNSIYQNNSTVDNENINVMVSYTDVIGHFRKTIPTTIQQKTKEII